MTQDDLTAASSPPPGGSSTVWGILYQMLWCLLRAVRLNMTEVERDAAGSVARAVLRLEPRDGGDLQELGLATRRVVQLKTRSGGRTWSLRDFIIEVLPDLYKAVDLQEDDTAYDFVTDAEMGRWQDAYAFFQSLRQQEPGDAPLDRLDDESELKFARQPPARNSDDPDPRAQASPFWGADRYTRRSLFERILRHLRQTSVVDEDEPVEQSCQKLWHLLARVNFIGGQTFARVETEVKSLLLALVDHPEQVGQKCDALLTWLSRRAAGGHATVETDELLREHGLDVTPLTAWATLRARARQLLRRELMLRQYDEAHDVRATVAAAAIWRAWRQGTPLLGVSGDTGDGKSWLLYALGLSAADGPGVAVVVDASGDADADLQLAADVFWQEVKGNGGSQPLSRIADQRKRQVQRHADQWFTVFVDGVQSPLEAERLARKGVEDWGVRLAITGPPDVVEVFRRAAGNRATISNVGPFTAEERDEYLARRLGDAWARVRSDVRDTLRRPLLAGIYCDEVAEPDGWRPTDEYDLFDRMWERLTTGAHAPSPLDSVRLANLAATVLQGAPYPWPAAALEEARIDAPMLDRLRRSGWLRSAPQQRFEVPHDRLLNYAVARGLLDARQVGRIDDERLTQTCRGLLLGQDTHGGRRLGYVPMDLFHLLLGGGTEGETALASLLVSLDDIHYHEREILYAELLPTLGARILPLLFTRLEALTATDAPFRQAPIVDGIISFDTPEVRARAIRLLNGDSPHLQRAAMRVLGKRPDAAALDRLWDLHCRMQAEPQQYGQDAGRGFVLYRESMDALGACVADDPAWIERAVHAAPTGGGHVHDLAYLLAGLPNGSETWRRCKTDLIAKVPADKVRSIVVNIGRYRDREELNRLVSLVAVSEDSAGPAAIRALARLDPGLAVEHLVRLPVQELYLTRGWYLPHLLEVRRDEVNRRLLAHMRVADDPWEVAFAYAGSEDDLDAETLQFLLDQFEAMLRRLAENPPPPNQHPLSGPLDLLAAVSKLELIGCFRRRRGTGVGRLLADFLIALGPQPGRSRDSAEREPALAVLAKIGGPDYVRVVNDYLSKGYHFGRLEAIAAAHRVGNADTKRLLAQISRQEEVPDGFPLEQQKAADALAALGETRLLVEAVLQLGLNISNTLDDLVTASRPFDDVAVEPAVRVLADECAPEPEHAAAVLALGVAGRRDRLPDVLDLLDRAAPESNLAQACTIALRRIGDGGQRSLDLLARQLARGRNPFPAHAALLNAGTDAALSIALDHVRRVYDGGMAVNLARRDQTRVEALNLIAEHVSDGGRRALDLNLQLPLAYLDDVAIQHVAAAGPVREALTEIALAEEGSFWVVGSKARAIRALATFDPSTAFLAAQGALENPEARDRARYPYLLVELDEPRAARVLLRQCARERSTAVRHAIARAMAGVDIVPDLAGLLDSPTAAERAAGCVLCAFRSKDARTQAKLGELLQDLDSTVADAALAALRRLSAAARCIELADAVAAPDTAAQERWTLLDAVLNVGDLGDEGQGSPGWLRRMDSALTADMWDYATKELNERRKKYLDELKRADARRR